MLVHYINTLTWCLITREIYTLSMRARQLDCSEDYDWMNNKYQQPYWSRALISREQLEQSKDFDWSRNKQEQSHWLGTLSPSSDQCKQSKHVDWQICLNKHFHWLIPRELKVSLCEQSKHFIAQFNLYSEQLNNDKNNLWQISLGNSFITFLY